MDRRQEKKYSDKIRNAAATRVVISGTNDGSKQQELQIRGLDGEILDGAEHFQVYGLTSVAPVGSEAVALPIGGDRSHMILIGVGDRGVRKKGLNSGDVCLYSQNGDYLLFKSDNQSEFKTKELKLDGEKITITGDLEILGNLTVAGTITAASVTASGISLTGHTHQGDSGGVTSPPNGG